MYHDIGLVVIKLAFVFEQIYVALIHLSEPHY